LRALLLPQSLSLMLEQLAIRKLPVLLIPPEPLELLLVLLIYQILLELRMLWVERALRVLLCENANRRGL
jgi:hypothetical protein